MKPIFCGNLDYDAHQSDVERLFRRYGRVDRVDIKSGLLGMSMLDVDGWVLCISFLGLCPRFIPLVFFQKNQSDPPWLHHPTFPCDRFAFIYMEDERDAEDAIRRLDRTEFGRKGRRLRVEWTKQERDTRSSGSSRSSSANAKPSKSLFVINFDPINTRTRDLERHFEPYGEISSVRIRRNFAFIQYESQEDAARALDATNMSKFMDRVISVEYAVRGDDARRNGSSPDRRGREWSPKRSGYGRGRSPSPYHRDRDSPDYRRGSNVDYRPAPKGSPVYDRGESPINDRYPSSQSPPRERSRS